MAAVERERDNDPIAQNGDPEANKKYDDRRTGIERRIVNIYRFVKYENSQRKVRNEQELDYNAVDDDSEQFKGWEGAARGMQRSWGYGNFWGPRVNRWVAKQILGGDDDNPYLPDPDNSAYQRGEEDASLIGLLTPAGPVKLVPAVKHGAVLGATWTKWGWQRGPKWMKAAKQLLAPKKHKDLLGKVPTVEEAKDLLEQAGCKPGRLEDAHLDPRDPHRYKHQHYTTPTGQRGSIQVQ